MDRIEAMKEYKSRQEQKAKDDANTTERHRSELALGIRSLKDRIQKLIETANACIEYDIPISTSSNKPYSYDNDKWEKGEFFTNCMSHKVGFTKKLVNNRYINVVDAIGINGGGANGNHYLRTNGEYVICTTGNLPEIYQMEKFLKDFDEFEAAFYAYLDTLLEQ